MIMHIHDQLGHGGKNCSTKMVKAENFDLVAGVLNTVTNFRDVAGRKSSFLCLPSWSLAGRRNSQSISKLGA